MDFDYSEEQRAIQESFIRFVDREVVPAAAALDAAHAFPRELFGRLGELGFFAMRYPEAVGGAGVDLATFCLALAEIARGSLSLAGAAAMQALMGTNFLFLLGNDDIRARLLMPALRGEKIGAICMTEPNAGSDLGGIATTAVKVEGGWRISGQKTWITSAPQADFFTVFARAGEARKLTIFLVERGTAGLAVGRAIEKMGVWALPTSEVAFDACFVPNSHMLSREVGDGEAHLRRILAEIRIITGAMANGVARAALAESVRYAGERQQFGKPIGAFQAIQFRLAEMATELEASEQLGALCRLAEGHRPPARTPGRHGQIIRQRNCGAHLRPGRADLRLLWLRHGVSGATLPARHPLHADRWRHQRHPQAHHRQGTARMNERRIRVLIAKPGLDGHDQGAKVVVRGLMEEGFEVIYTGLRQTPLAVANAALEEGVDVIGLSSMAGSHLPFCRKLRPLLEERGLAERLWIIGGNIPAADCTELRELGFSGIFPTGARISEIASFIRERVS